MRLTPGGRALSAAAAMVLIGGWAADYRAIVGIGAALVAALLLGWFVVSRPTPIDAARIVVPERVAVGGEAESVLTVVNTSSHRAGAGTVRERVGEREMPVALPALDPGGSTIVRRSLPTDRRGVFTVGPLSIRQGDPLGLIERGARARDVARLIVHPIIHRVSPFPTGVTRDLDGTPSGESSEGGVAFSGLREYVPGDDLRLIHWKSSARVGDLVVRHNVDHQQPRTAVIVDTRASVHNHESFEDTIRIAASVIAAAATRHFPFTLRTTCGRHLDGRTSHTAVMDMLSAIELSDDPTLDLGQAGRLAATDPAGLSLACVTGRATVRDLQGLGPLRARYDQVTIVRTGDDAPAGVYELSGAVLLNVNTSSEFARLWNRRIGR